jgi:hypothetical protein
MSVNFPQVTEKDSDKFYMGTKTINQKQALRIAGPIKFESIQKLLDLGYTVILVSK